MANFLTSEHKNIVLYIAKCVSGFALLSLVGQVANILDISWVVISMLLVLSPDSAEVVPLTITRIQSNLLASVTSILVLCLCPNITLAICISIAVTILGCYWFGLMAGSRPALAAVVIISLHPAGMYLWSTAAERVLAVVSGCVIGLALTFLFHRAIIPMRDDTEPKQSE